MSERVSVKETIRYDEPGTLVRPGPIGRLVRAFLGLLCTSLAWQIGTQSVISDIQNPYWWFLIVLGMLLVTYVVNIGFGLSIGAWPRNLSIALLILSAIASYTITGQFLGTPLFITVASWMVYVYGHLGTSFLLSSILATPGCEMRAIPHLLGMAKGKKVAEHYCPAFIDNIDKWEHERNDEVIQKGKIDTDDPRSKDILRGAGRLILVYGIPFAAMQLAGNFGGFLVATQVPAIVFIAISVVCFVNIVRCRRVHCYLLGPLFLVAGIGMGLYSFRMFSFGPGTWSIIVNLSMIGGACLSFHMELIWGLYFSKK